MPRFRFVTGLCDLILPSRLMRRKRNIGSCAESSHRSEMTLSAENLLRAMLMMFNVRSYTASVQILCSISTSLILNGNSWPEGLSFKHIQSSFLRIFPIFSPNISPNLKTWVALFCLLLYSPQVPSCKSHE